MQTSPEYDFICRQTFDLAKLRVDQAIRDRNWVAVLDHPSNLDTSDSPLAVIMDVDETVADNSPFHARLIRSNSDVTAEQWEKWVSEAQAEVPGSSEFIAYLRSKNITPIFITNREAEGELATVQNLQAIFGDSKINRENVLCKNEKPGWGPDKSSRRAYIAKTYRVALLLGDDYNDFAFLGENPTPPERKRLAAEHLGLWGTKWILMPNPLYGSWEKALYHYDRSQSDGEKLRQKYNFLDTRHQR